MNTVALPSAGEGYNLSEKSPDMAGIAFDVLLETDVLVEVLPLWEDEWEHPERFNNPMLIENSRRKQDIIYL
jgi:hypothetical protein